MNKIKTFLLAITSLFATCKPALPQTVPTLYYQFNSGAATQPSVGATVLTGGGTYTNPSTNPIVGNYIQWQSNADFLSAGTVNTTFQATVQFWFRAGYNMFKVRNSQMMLWGDLSLSIEYPNVTFYSNNNALALTLNGIGRGAWGYWFDNNWHHVALVVNMSTGRKEVWIDGQLPAGFSVTTPTGSMTTGLLRFNANTSYTQYYGDLDELAIYTTALDARQIYQNYTESKAGNHYTTAFAASVPAAQTIVGTMSPTDFAIGTNIGTNPTTGATQSPVTQIRSYPIPRYKPTNTLLPMYNNGDPEYEGQRFQSGVSDAQAVINDTMVQRALCEDFNFMIYSKATGNTDPFQIATLSFANSHTQHPLSSQTLRFQINGGNPAIRNQSYTAPFYLQNSGGTFIGQNGLTTGGLKLWRPTTVESQYSSDGTTMSSNLSGLIATQTNRPSNRKIDHIFENGEEINILSNNALNNDPRCRDSVTAFGGNFQQWYAYRYKRVETISYSDIFLGLTGLTNTRFQWYAIDGETGGNQSDNTSTNQGLPYRFVYSYARQVMKPIGGTYYSTPDFYVIRPELWYWESYSPTVDGRAAIAHGWKWMQNSRATEIALGDKLYSPFVAAGWYANEATNVRPSQYLGLCKIHAPLGAEFYYPSFFSLGTPWPNATNWIWQIAMPSYAQAITSRFEDILKNGDVLAGDVPFSYVTGGTGYQYYSGDQRDIVCIRKKSGSNKYAIAAVVNPLSNIVDTTCIAHNATITLAGQTLQFEVRKQGSVYIYDNSVSPAVFYQLDKWHENAHPSWWSTDFNIEAEVYDTAGTGVSLSTVRPNTAAGDFRNYTTYVKFSGIDSVSYNFQPRTVANQYLYLYARSSDGTSTGANIYLDNAGVKLIDCITDTNWTWYRYNTADGIPITYSSLSALNHTLKIKSTNSKLNIDKFTISTNANLYTSVITSCGSVTATITPSGATTFCSGGSVTLTANNASSYVWNTGATTQSINVNTSGSYTVTVTVAGVGTATSSPTTVTVLPLPTVTVTPSGSTTFCTGGSVTLTSSAASSYLWSTSATTQAISVSTSGTYTVTVTAANGCTRVSASTSVTVNASPTATITAGGTTTFCTGSAVSLIASSGTGYTYQWNRNGNPITGATNSTYSASSSGGYTATVTSSGCSSVSNTITVTTVSNPTTANAGTDQSICTDSTTLQGNTPVSGTGLWTLISGSGTITNSSNPTTAITSLGAGANVFRWTISNNPCAPSTDNVTITKTSSSPVSVTITASANPFCSGATVTFTALPVNGGNPTFQWKKNGANVGTNSSSYSSTVNNGDLITCVLTSDLVCGSGSPATSNTITMSLSTPTASITAGGSTSFCTGGSVVLSANTGSGLTYQWKNSGGNISGQTLSSYTATTAETYTCVVTNSANCSATSNSIVVSVSSAPTATITPNGSTTFCFGDSLILTSSSGTSYLWSTSATTQSIAVKVGGNYRVTVTTGSCSATSAALPVNTTSKPSVSITVPSNPICSGSTQTLTATINSAYLWNTGATTQTITAGAGVYVVTVTSNSCTNTATANISSTDCGNCDPPTTCSIQAYWNSAYLDWNSVTNATSYILTLRNDQTGALRDVTFRSSWGYFLRLTKNTQYSVTIKSYCNGVSISPDSPRFFFKTNR